MAGELIRREALERIIQRAAELQAGERDIGEGLTEPELLALGQDVGIPARYLRQALLEERTRPLIEERGGLLRSEEHTSELQSPCNLVCRLLLEKKKVTTSKSQLLGSGTQ